MGERIPPRNCEGKIYRDRDVEIEGERRLDPPGQTAAVHTVNLDSLQGRSAWRRDTNL